MFLACLVVNYNNKLDDHKGCISLLLNIRNIQKKRDFFPIDLKKAPFEIVQLLKSFEQAVEELRKVENAHANCTF